MTSALLKRNEVSSSDLGRMASTRSGYVVPSLILILPFGSVEDVRNEVREIIDNYGENGGLVIMPSNEVGFDVLSRTSLPFLKQRGITFPY